MTPLQSIAQFWHWLPALRAIAETCHLPSAAATLGVTPSALSRSLSQLERALGVPLFRRSKGRLELLPAGEAFLAALREAMRTVHEATLELKRERWMGGLRVASSGLATSAWVLPALLELRSRHPELHPQMSTDLTDAVKRLLSGALDLVVCEEPIAHKRLRTVCLGTFRRGIYCGSEHPLLKRSNLAPGDLLAFEFVAPPPDANGAASDGWPVDLERRVGLEVDQIRLGCQALLQSELIAILPDLVARSLGHGELRRLNLEIAPDAEIFAALRTSIGAPTHAEGLLSVIERRAQADQE